MNGGDAEDVRATGGLAARLSALAPAQRALLERALEQQRRRAAQQAAAAARQEAPPRIPRRPPGSIVPLSLDQERLWFIQQLDRLSPVYNIYGANRFRGPIGARLLTAALNLLVARHEVLRTTFPA
ncbi:MAG TPA: condensation domain-containing protein, partial [Thermoanaerobaculia bacterium]|nr:condensation domain-containing protein [Thermoanaerobaculia bacterium]